MSVTCERCDDEGYVCILCEEPPDGCECYDDMDDDEEVPDVEVKRCVCNPRPRHLKR